MQRCSSHGGAHGCMHAASWGAVGPGRPWGARRRLHVCCGAAELRFVLSASRAAAHPAGAPRLHGEMQRCAAQNCSVMGPKHKASPRPHSTAPNHSITPKLQNRPKPHSIPQTPQHHPKSQHRPKPHSTAPTAQHHPNPTASPKPHNITPTPQRPPNHSTTPTPQRPPNHSFTPTPQHPPNPTASPCMMGCRTECCGVQEWTSLWGAVGCIGVQGCIMGCITGFGAHYGAHYGVQGALWGSVWARYGV